MCIIAQIFWQLDTFLFMCDSSLGASLAGPKGFGDWCSGRADQSVTLPELLFSPTDEVMETVPQQLEMWQAEEVSSFFTIGKFFCVSFKIYLLRKVVS